MKVLVFIFDSYLGGYYRDTRDPPPLSQKFNLRASGQRFLQRLTSLRHSVRRRERTRPTGPLPPTESNPDTDRVFFRGFSGVSARPTAPPRRRKPKARVSRSQSLSCADIVSPGTRGLSKEGSTHSP